MDLLLFLFLGIIISILSGFFGVGGGFILTPILLLLGFSPLEAIVTSLLFSMGTSVSGVIAHYRLKNILWRKGLAMGIFGMAATQAAKPFVLYLNERGWDEIVIPGLYITFLAYFAFTMIWDGQAVLTTEQKQGFPPLVRLALIGLLGGAVSTTLGVGGGFIMVPLTIAFLGLEPKKAVGTSLLAVLAIVTTGFFSYTYTEAVTINYPIGFCLIAGGLIGSQFGAKWTVLYKNKEMKLLLGSLYTATLISVVSKLAHFNTFGLTLLSVFVLFFLTLSILRIIQKQRLKEKLSD